MTHHFLPSTNLKVSNVCLGTMTFGQQNSEHDAHEQLDFALEKGINFIDTAEMYAVPAREETYGLTEKFIGSWFKKSGKRSEMVLATKIAGANRTMPYIRDDMRYTEASIRLSVEKSLSRLQTDYIDLYQLHWPERKTNMFGQLGYVHEDEDWADNTVAVLETMGGLIKEGKIRHFGLSNETPWGLMRFLNESKINGLPKPVSLQNPYSLLNRILEIGLSEICLRENVGVLAYSPLAFGMLTGKFLNNNKPADARLTLFPQFMRYSSKQCQEATVAYNEIAKANNLSLTQLSLAFLKQQKVVASTIIGVTTIRQLEENIDAFNSILSDEVIKSINDVQVLFPNPAP
jgi:aryl-alcohol dehydrogenase-like predicted oxidoreductase